MKCEKCDIEMKYKETVSGYSPFHRMDMDVDIYECPKCGEQDSE